MLTLNIGDAYILKLYLFYMFQTTAILLAYNLTHSQKILRSIILPPRG